MEIEQISTLTLLSLITNRYKIPDDIFIRAMYYNELKTALNELLKIINLEYDAAIENAKNTTSESYRVTEHKKTVTLVDIDLLRETNQDVFKKAVRIKPFDAVKILSKEFIYDSCKNKLGEERIKKYEDITKTDLKNIIGSENAEKYYKTEEKSIGFFVDAVEK